MPTHAKWLIALITVSSLGCAQHMNTSDNTVQVKRLYASPQCEYSEITPALTQIMDTQQLTAMLPQGLLEPSALPEFPPPDFDTDVLVLVQLGQRPNAGFSLAITSESGALLGPQLELPVQAISPAADAINASVIVSPCVLLSFAAANVQSVSALGVALDIAQKH